jgi:hypothetical protein
MNPPAGSGIAFLSLGLLRQERQFDGAVGQFLLGWVMYFFVSGFPQ